MGVAGGLFLSLFLGNLFKECDHGPVDKLESSFYVSSFFDDTFFVGHDDDTQG